MIHGHATAIVRYIFDQFVLDTSRFELSENGNAIPAEPQVIELLAFFVRNSDRLITREELIESVWKGRVVSDSAISGRIKVARKVLGDNGRQQKYIRTIHKKGFSFVAHARTQAGFDSTNDVDLKTGVNRRDHDQRPSIGVLKFANLSEAIEKDYFADGLTEDLITTLSKISKLIVVAHPQALQSNSNGANAVRAGVDMDVRYVLHGSVRSDGRRLRISAHLVETGSGECLWAQRYDCLNKDIFDLQDEVTKAVVSALQVELTEGDQALLLSREREI